MRRLWLKLFFVLVIANVIFAVVLYFGFTWSFELAFKRYLKEQEQTRFTPLIEALVEEYRTEREWEWILTEHGRWRALMREYIVNGEQPPGQPRRLPPRPQQMPPLNPSDGSRPNPPPPRGERANAGPNAGGQSSERAPGQSGPGVERAPDGRIIEPNITTRSGLNPHILLFDANGDVVIGNTNRPETIYRFPIDMDGERIGTIGVRAETTLLVAMQTVMANQNDGRLNVIIVGLLFVSSVIAFVLATWLTRRIFRIKIGTGALVRGQFDHRIDAKGKDALADLAHDFNGLAESLEENRSAHRRWIASTSHELRTPVTILQGQIEALRDGIREVTPDYLEGLSDDIKRLNTLIDDLHQLSMSDLGALDYKKDEVDLVELIDDELDKMTGLLPDGLSLNWVPPEDDMMFVLGDGHRLSQLVKNLMQNSIRYTDAPGDIQVGIRASSRSVTITWEDSSPGVSQEECELLTQPLYRTESSRSRAIGGSGLGLSIVQAIVKAHDGKLVAERSRLGGLKWTIKLRRLAE